MFLHPAKDLLRIDIEFSHSKAELRTIRLCDSSMLLLPDYRPHLRVFYISVKLPSLYAMLPLAFTKKV